MTQQLGFAELMDDGVFSGNLETLERTIRFIVVPRDAALEGSEKSPSHVILTPDRRRELGAAWERESKKGDAYLNCRFQAPEFPCEYSLRLVKMNTPNPGEDHTHVLLWN